MVWDSVWIYCGFDLCGGVNGVCICLVLQKDWEGNEFVCFVKVLVVLELFVFEFGVLIVDMIVFVGNVGIEKVVVVGGYVVLVLFVLGWGDVIDVIIDVDSFVFLELIYDGFCNWVKVDYVVSDEELLLDWVQLMGLSVLEMMVLFGGLWVFGINYGGIEYGVFIDCEGVLMIDFFVNLIDMDNSWNYISDNQYDICDCRIGIIKWMVLCVDLVFGFNFMLCVIVEVYVQDDVVEKFVGDFVVVWVKVMNVDCYDLV